jgi:hypothetical protein
VLILFSHYRLRYVMYMRGPRVLYPFRLLYTVKRYIFSAEIIAADRLSCLLDADIVCSRAKNHYDPQGRWDLAGDENESSMDPGQAKYSLDRFQQAFKPLHANQKSLMYFSVSKLYTRLRPNIN